MGNTQAGRDNNLSIHQRLLQSTTPPFSTRLEKSGRLRAEGGLNENLERRKNVTGPPGDVKAQVANLITESVSHGVADMLVGEEPVELVITLRQFHALTPRARLSNLQLGVHEIVFDIEVRNERGDLIASEDGINADLRAFSGFKAYEAEVRGATQRKSIRQRVADVVRRWLAPWSFEKA